MYGRMAVRGVYGLDDRAEFMENLEKCMCVQMAYFVWKYVYIRQCYTHALYLSTAKRHLY